MNHKSLKRLKSKRESKNENEDAGIFQIDDEDRAFLGTTYIFISISLYISKIAKVHQDNDS